MGQPYFNKLTVGVAEFEFSHLEPFTFVIDSQLAKKALQIHVTFSNHCFTKGYKVENHVSGEPIIDPSSAKPRLFCPIRYSLSKSLPSIISSLNHPKLKVWETVAERNWAHSILIDDPAGPYHVFLTVGRPSAKHRHLQDLDLKVESAYHQDPGVDPPRLRGSMSFLLLCGKVYIGQPTSTKR